MYAFENILCYSSHSMNDIKIPLSGGGQQKPGFITKHLEAAAKTEPQAHAGSDEPSTKVKVHFEKFVELIAKHDFEKVMQKYGKEDIVLSTNLLTELANAYPEEEVRNTRMPVVLIVGIIIGVILTYLIIRF